MKITFFNHFHNGDVHLARGFIQQIMKRFPEHEYSYAHRNPKNLIAEIPFGEMPICSEFQMRDQHFYNTWYGQYNRTYLNQYGISFDCLYHIFDDHCKHLFQCHLSDISENPLDFFPSIDYNQYYIQSVSNWIVDHLGDDKVLVENGQVLSGQSENFDLSQVICRVAINHPETLFLVSEKIQDCPVNVIYCGDIIQKPERSDLNEISYLSKYCRLIIGRNSGVSSFCFVKENLDKPMLMFSGMPQWHPALNMKSYPDTNLDRVQQIIEGAL